MTEQELLNELAQVRLLSALTYPTLRRLAQYGRLVQAREGQVIIGPGFGSTGFFVVLDGTVTVSMPFGPVLQYMGKGDYFGEIALLDGLERSAYCRAYTDCLLFEVPFGSFHADLITNEAVRAALDEETAERLQQQRTVRKGGPAPEVSPPGEAEEPSPTAVGEGRVRAPEDAPAVESAPAA